MIHVEDIRNMKKNDDVKRFLIDREWPRDVVRAIPRKEKSGGARAALAEIRWLPELAPSPALWKWFHHDAEKVGAFRNRYFRELEGKEKQWTGIVHQAGEGEVTLLYHGKSARSSPAYFLKEFLGAQSKGHKIQAQARKKSVRSPG